MKSSACEIRAADPSHLIHDSSARPPKDLITACATAARAWTRENSIVATLFQEEELLKASLKKHWYVARALGHRNNFN
jgi:hypothetical protein